MTHFEHMTRAAAAAISLDLVGFVWNDQAHGLVRGNYPINVWPTEFFPEVFAPLHEPGDAFTLESHLRLDVTYTANGNQVGIHAKAPQGGPQYLVLIEAQACRATALKARMLAVTTLAAMCAVAEGYDHVR